jgi:hypothetical protein
MKVVIDSRGWRREWMAENGWHKMDGINGWHDGMMPNMAAMNAISRGAVDRNPSCRLR